MSLGSGRDSTVFSLAYDFFRRLGWLLSDDPRFLGLCGSSYG